MAKFHGKGTQADHHHLTSHADPVKGKDAVAHDSHHRENKKHGLGLGMAPVGGQDGGVIDESHLGVNEDHC